MALKNLSAQAMVHVSSAWLDPARQLPLLQSQPLLAALIPTLRAAHDGVIKTHFPDTTPPPEAAQIQEKQAALDGEHDRTIRGIHTVLTGLADLAEEPGHAAQLLDLRDRLMPGGLRMMNRTYEEQAGEADLLQQRLDTNTVASLRALLLPAPTNTMETAVLRWQDRARKIGALEEEKRALTNTQPAVKPADSLAARNAWVRAANAVLSNLDLLQDLPPADRTRLLAALEAAEANADRRHAPAKDVPAPTPVPA